jgi:GT2 family glycosyltransferase
MKNNISLLVGLKNNLDYNKHFYETTRELYPDVELCFVSYGSTDGTHEWLDSLRDKYVRYFYSEENKTFSDTFNMAATIATSDYVAYLHNDIVLGPKFLENLEKHVAPNRIVSYTTIEPPIFGDHTRPGKLIFDFGQSLETFSKDLFREYCEIEHARYEDKTEPGITFFMCMPRKELLEIGGLDPLYNPMFCEDDDLIRRWKMLGMECFTALDAMCYHFVSKTSRFSEEYERRTQAIELASNRNYIRKWGSKSNAPKYNIAFVVHNCTLPVLEALEPWCDRIYIEDEMEVIVNAYIEREQPNTRYDLRTRVLHINQNVPNDENDIIVAFDVKRITNTDFQYIQQLPEILAADSLLSEFNQPGETFALGNLLITIWSAETYEKNLIKCK